MDTLDFVANKPKSPVKDRQVRVYLSGENADTLSKLCDAMPDLAETEIIRVLVSASLRAIKENGFTLAFPLNFQIEKPAHRRAMLELNEK